MALTMEEVHEKGQHATYPRPRCPLCWEVQPTTALHEAARAVIAAAGPCRSLWPPDSGCDQMEAYRVLLVTIDELRHVVEQDDGLRGDLAVMVERLLLVVEAYDKQVVSSYGVDVPSDVRDARALLARVNAA